WFGGCVAIFISVMSLFAHDREIAVQAAPQIFVTFGKFQLLLGAVALLATFAWYVMVRSTSVTWLLALFMLAAIGASILALTIIPKMEEMRLAGNAGTPEYRALHKKSSSLYSMTTIALLIGGCVMPAALKSTRRQAASSDVSTTPVPSGAAT